MSKWGYFFIVLIMGTMKVNAEVFPDPLIISVSGTGNLSAIISEAFEKNIQAQVSLREGVLSFNSPESIKFNLTEGQWKQGIVPITIYKGSQTYFRKINFIVSYQRPLFLTESKLFVSNEPEKLTKESLLKVFSVDGKKTFRLLYHHANFSAKRIRLVSSLVNKGLKPVSFFVRKGIGGPSVDEVFLGQSSLKRYLKAFRYDIGYWITIPPRSTVQLFSQQMAPQKLSSGIIDLVPQDEVQNVKWVLFTHFGERSLISTRSEDNSLEHVQRTDGEMIEAQISFERHINSADDPYHWRIGGYPSVKNVLGMPLAGNYGVHHNLQLEASNQEASDQELFIHFLPRGGIAGAVFLVDNELIEIKPQPAGKRVAAKRIEFKSFETKKINILYIPQAGSNYPIELIFTWRKR